MLARKAHALGMRVIATRRRPVGKPLYVDRLLPSAGLTELLQATAHVVHCLPLTPETRGVIGAAELALMRRSAYLYNVGRGGLIDQEALIAALRAGQIAGAGLDVTDPEPLVATSPLWDLPNVLLTMHSSGATPRRCGRGSPSCPRMYDVSSMALRSAMWSMSRRDIEETAALWRGAPRWRCSPCLDG